MRFSKNLKAILAFLFATVGVASVCFLNKFGREVPPVHPPQHPPTITRSDISETSVNFRAIPPQRIPSIGRSDLDPFAPTGSGGMLYNPFEPRRDIENPGLGIPGGLPRGAVPPGARFDPFGPPGGPMPGRRPAPPDADHLPPPGFNDNMFM